MTKEVFGKLESRIFWGLRLRQAVSIYGMESILIFVEVCLAPGPGILFQTSFVKNCKHPQKPRWCEVIYLFNHVLREERF